ncbi:MAG: preprotein translocase subunit SecE [Candidatus Dormibacteraeota bacterium]|uniref:Protein translocase subunit SecE n=1 Tax=Candidatus Aeolococcus gillhamiae TaxID=3127015 RepID=A0A934K4L9_9BACT|nr:preprotein translocase subunit SecE [Candidatus Dormibacteraeota bacterium]
MARAVRGQPVRQRAPVGPPVGAGDRNYFASVVDELRKVVWPTWNELGRMTGVVVTTVILMAVIVSVADYGLGFVVKQLYSSSSTTGSQVTARPSQIKPSAAATSAPTIPRTVPTSAGGSTAPVSP